MCEAFLWLLDLCVYYSATIWSWLECWISRIYYFTYSVNSICVCIYVCVLLCVSLYVSFVFIFLSVSGKGYLNQPGTVLQ